MNAGGEKCTIIYNGVQKYRQEFEGRDEGRTNNTRPRPAYHVILGVSFAKASKALVQHTFISLLARVRAFPGT